MMVSDDPEYAAITNLSYMKLQPDKEIAKHFVVIGVSTTRDVTEAVYATLRLDIGSAEYLAIALVRAINLAREDIGHAKFRLKREDDPIPPKD